MLKMFCICRWKILCKLCDIPPGQIFGYSFEGNGLIIEGDFLLEDAPLVRICTDSLQFLCAFSLIIRIMLIKILETSCLASCFIQFYCIHQH